MGVTEALRAVGVLMTHRQRWQEFFRAGWVGFQQDLLARITAASKLSPREYLPLF